MQELRVKCPCCGRHLVLSITVDSVAAEVIDQNDMVRIASDLGIELGAMKGGEEVGD